MEPYQLLWWAALKIHHGHDITIADYTFQAYMQTVMISIHKYDMWLDFGKPIKMSHLVYSILLPQLIATLTH